MVRNPGGSSSGINRKFPVGAEIVSGGASFRVWAPLRKQVEVILDGAAAALEAEGGGYFSGAIDAIVPGARYRFRLDGGDAFADPASRFQPEGPHGPSQLVDPGAFRWTDAEWRGLSIAGQVVYEMHIGTFTQEGTWQAAIRELPHVARLGITVLEVMPIADFSGTFGWGYDGVNLFAPCRLYGSPEDAKQFVDTAHSLGMAVILDVVYNHFGADGNYTGQYSRDYVTAKHKTDWGEAINFDGRNCGPVREFFVTNAAYWIDEYHMDGLRIDATQNIYDDTPNHILAEITRAVRQAAGHRQTIIVAENEPQQVKLVRPRQEGGYGMDALWNDDLHHSAMVALTGRSEAYYTDYRGSPQEFISAAKYGYLYQGQWYKWQEQRRGTPSLGVDPSAFVTFIENHDQVANSAYGARVHMVTSPGRYRAVTAYMLLAPGTPMLFQGQEFASSKPFYYFADQKDLRELVRSGRREFLYQWRSIATKQLDTYMVDPCAESTFEASKLDGSERERHRHIYALHADLIRLRREDPVLRAPAKGSVDGAVLSASAFVLRYFNHEHGDRLLVVNLGHDLNYNPAPEPLLAAAEEKRWSILFSTENPKYGGWGTAPLETDVNWSFPGEAAVLLAPRDLTAEERRRPLKAIWRQSARRDNHE